AQWRGLDDVANLDAGLRAVAEDVLDPARLVVQAEDDFVDFRHLLQQVDLVVEERTVEYRDDGLRRVERERPEPRALAPDEKDGLHDNRRSYPKRMTATGSIRLHAPVTMLASGSHEPAERAHDHADLSGPLAGRRPADQVRGAGASRHPHADRRRRHLRAGVGHRLARWLPRAAARAG